MLKSYLPLLSLLILLTSSQSELDLRIQQHFLDYDLNRDNFLARDEYAQQLKL